MCKADKFLYHRKLWEMKVKFLGDSKIEKFKNSLVSRSRMSLWMIRVMTILLLWSCLVHFVALGEMWGPRLLKGWPSCFNHHDFPMAAEMTSLPMKIALPPKSKFLSCYVATLQQSGNVKFCLLCFIIIGSSSYCLFSVKKDCNFYAFCALSSYQGYIRTMAILWFLAMEDSTKCEQR